MTLLTLLATSATLGDAATSLPNVLGIAFTWLLGSLLVTVVCWAVSMLLERHSPRASAERALLFVVYLLLALGGAALALEGHDFTTERPLLAAPLPLLAYFFFYLFSDNQFARARERWLSLLYVINRIVLYAPQGPSKSQASPVFLAMLTIPGVMGFILTFSAFGAVALMVIALPRQVFARYRRRPVDGAYTRRSVRQWLAIVALLCLLGYPMLMALVWLTYAPWQAVSPLVAIAGALFFAICALTPLSASFALARGRALDGDALRNRALRYGALTVGIVAFYAAMMALFRLFFPGFAQLTTFAYVPFILVIALLMATFYRQAQAWLREQIDRSFFHRRYAASRALAAFAATASTAPTEARLDEFAASLPLTLQKAFAPAAVACWLPAPAVASAAPTAMLTQSSPAPSSALDMRSALAPATASATPAILMASAPRTPDGALRLRWVAGEPRPSTAASALVIDRDDPLAAALARPAALPLAPASGPLLASSASPSPSSPAAEALREMGMRLALPLAQAGAVAGLLTLGELPGGPVTADERELLADFTAQVTPALAAAQQAQVALLVAQTQQRAEQEMLTARRIQEALLPKVTPTLAGWRLATCYQPARAVGGDFYDFIPLPDGRLGLALGDVTDKGIPAALVMATTRSMLRAVAQQGIAPGQALAHVNNLLCDDLPPSMFVTCFYAVLDPVSGRLRFANAGQDLPCARGDDHVARELYARGMPLGLMPDMPYEEGEVTLQRGESVVFYSDGLVEAHNPAREMFGLPRLLALLSDYGEEQPPIAYLLHALMSFTGPDWEQEDDITLVTLQRAEEATVSEPDDTPTDAQAEVEPGWRLLGRSELPSAPGGEREAMRLVAEALRGVDLSPQRAERLQTAVSEAVMNAMEYGGGYRAESLVTVETLSSADAARVRVSDEGSAFALPAPVAPDLDAKLAGMQSPRGWGLFLIERLMDDVQVSGDERRHTITMTIHLRDAAPESHA